MSHGISSHLGNILNDTSHALVAKYGLSKLLLVLPNANYRNKFGYIMHPNIYVI